jgi:hypothetical protein
LLSAEEILANVIEDHLHKPGVILG